MGAWNIYSCEYLASVRKSSLILFCWFMDGFFLLFSPPPLSFVMQWAALGSILASLASFIVFCRSFFLLLGKESCNKSTTWWKRNFLQWVVVETYCQGNSVNIPIWDYLETIAFQIFSQVAFSIVAFNHSIEKKLILIFIKII